MEEEFLFDEALVVPDDLAGEGRVGDLETELDVAVEGGLREVGRGDEEVYLVTDESLGMEDTAGAVVLAESLWVVENAGATRA